MEYIKNIIKDFPEEIVGTKTSPAADHQFHSEIPIPGKGVAGRAGADAFHRTMAQLLFLSARAPRDIQPATAFLTTRVRRSPDKYDWNKVKRVLSYLKGTLHMPPSCRQTR